MKVLEIASLSKEVIEAFGKCIFFVKGDKSNPPAIGVYCVKSNTITIYEEDLPSRLEWFTHLMPLDSLYE